MVDLSQFSQEHSPEALEARMALLCEDPACSDWLKDAIRSALERDPVDAANDAEILADLLAKRCNSLLGSADRR
ncbi:hypothetical protein SAMN06297251_10887 [Fulvimarina manganoxydans]|uniref:Uncharacterized protein n=1 Tax=Fulvimarina manganoxydans TaxID=937218 RepID=A0A1W2C194_9HYPH|nr:hypothetical protein [Fulvimarina manganoxydans]MCK5934080.1 hypothetical protein [Fulvimarina manganoxydans]SMC79005.1 hypothetical protein SAMN06297251_10887 [Fulvimarina manganoxydans]